MNRGIVSAGSKPRPLLSKRKQEESSGDEGGRSSLGKKKYRKSDEHDGEMVVERESMGHYKHQDQRQAPLKHSKATGTYIDEVLSQKEKKRKKKHKANPTNNTKI